MTDATADPTPDVPRKGKKLLLLALVLGLTLGAGAFASIYLGLILSPSEESASKDEDLATIDQDFAFVPLETLVVSLGPEAQAAHLVITLQLEVPKAYVGEVEFLKPRIADVLNSYLRALAPEDIERSASLVRLRGHMLRRVQIIVGEGRIRDLLVTEFVLN